MPLTSKYRLPSTHQGCVRNHNGPLLVTLGGMDTAFVLTWFFGFKDSDVEAERTVKKVRLGRRDPVAK